MQSNKIHNVVLMSKFYSAAMLARHVSELIGLSSGAFYLTIDIKLLIWDICLTHFNTRQERFI